MKCVVKKHVLASFLEAIVPITNDCRAVVDDSGISIRAVCSANVSLVIASLPREAFVSIDETGATEQVGIEVGKILTAVNLLDDADDEITLEKIVDDPFLYVSGPGIKYSWRSIDPNTIRKDPNPPSIELATRVTMDGTVFRKAIDKVTKIADKVRIVIDTDGRCHLDAEGDTDTIKISLDDATVSGPIASSLFGLDYLGMFAKVLGKADGEIALKVGVDYPVLIEFSRDGGDYQYMLAPRIEAD